MANLHRLTTQESLNAFGVGGVWDVLPNATHSGTAAANTIHVNVSEYTQLGILSEDSIYFNFSDNEEDCSTTNDLKIDSDTLTFITVPNGVGKVIYFNHLGVTACNVRMVGI